MTTDLCMVCDPELIKQDNIRAIMISKAGFASVHLSKEYEVQNTIQHPLTFGEKEEQAKTNL